MASFFEKLILGVVQLVGPPKEAKSIDFEKSSTYFKMACIQNVHLFNVFGIYLERYSVR